MIDNPKQESTQTTKELLFYATLLAGLGVESKSIVAELHEDSGGVLEADERSRTCIDAGNTLMFSILAPGKRSLRVLTRLPDRVGEPNIGRWRRANYSVEGKSERCLSQTFLAEEAVVWKYALAMAQSVDGEEQFRHLQAILGTRGRIYEITSSVNAEEPCGWIGWQIDRRCSPDEALIACGQREAWRRATLLLEQVLGHSISQRWGPWSIAWTLQRERPLLRFGTTSWARNIEDEAKRKRLAAVVTSMGGDGRFAEALYKLIDADRPQGIPARIGRAVEIEFDEGQLRAIEFYLCAPT